MKPKVLFLGDLNRSLPEFKEFESNFECIDYTLTTVEKLIEDFKTRFSTIEAIYGAWLGLSFLGGFRNEILENAPKSLKVIAVCSVGFDSYDGEGMAKKDIILTNVPSLGASEPVADLVLYNTIASFRNFKFDQSNFTPDHNHTVHLRKMLDSNQFDLTLGKIVLGDPSGYSFGEKKGGRFALSPKGHNALIVGFGSIGQKIGQRLSQIGMNIHYVKRSKLSEKEENKLGYEIVYHKSIIDAKKIADLIVIACPGTPETKHLINRSLIDSMSKPFRIINIGRGSIVDEKALVEGLKTGKILFAGLDVFEDEPKVNPELFNRDDVILTPHIGASTVENFDFTAIYAMKNIENILLHQQNGLSRVN
ncbi:uncharacterized protein PRCAT00001373001 [Priceomyces carsonii]|uniref:uncharacterized protein n=1 Tax=Priceomyces carsonii TaxID=28549 RepID=UPI002ED88071|nr:unnamed protein product [Priceomyces carsonii]